MPFIFAYAFRNFNILNAGAVNIWDLNVVLSVSKYALASSYASLTGTVLST